MLTCPVCGTENPERAKFCLECAAPLTGGEGSRESRRTVTILFCDLTGSTALGERLDPESLERVIASYYEAMREPIERHGGLIEKFIGDAVMAVFGLPHIREDDALRAVRAADEMREALAVLNKALERDHGATLQIRVGVNTGEVVARDPSAGQHIVVGDPVNVAARLEQAAAPGEVLLGEPTLQLVRGAVDVETIEPLALKGKSEPVPAFRLVRVVPGAAGFARRLDAPMVGRARELELLRAAFERAMSDRACQLFTVLGVGGVGKSRLMLAFVDELGERATVLRGRCLPYGDGITFWPLVEALTEAAGLGETQSPGEVRDRLRALVPDAEDADTIADRVAQVIGSSGTAAPEETLWAVRRLLEAMASARPTVFVIDDIQWAEPTLLELIEYVADWSRDAPILLACMARPELLQDRPSWGGGKLNATTIALEALTTEECELLVSNLLATDEVAEDVRARVAEAAEGHPLFAEEMLATMVEDGILVSTEGRWVAVGDLSSIAVPPTISALLAARLDRLDADERGTLELASVAGQIFYVKAVEALFNGDGRVRDHLASLARKQFVHAQGSDLPGLEALAFRHLLIRDTAYEAMPKARRADLHERLAAWLESELGGRVIEQQEIVGFHLERAHDLLAELGPADERQSALADRAALYLRGSGERANARGDMPAAARLLERAARLMRRDDPLRVDVLTDAALAARDHGWRPLALSLLQEMVETAERTGDVGLIARAELIRHHRGEDMAAPGWIAECDRLARRVLEVASGDDDLSLGWAWDALGGLAWQRCRSDEADPAWRRALDHYRHAGKDRLVQDVFTWYAGIPLLGPMPCDQALEVLRGYLQERELPLEAEWDLQSTVGWLLAMQGEVDEARRLMRGFDEVLRELGRWESAAFTQQMLGWVELMSGNPMEAERLMRKATEELEAMGSEWGGVLWSIRAQALYELGRYDEAEAAAVRRSSQFGDLSTDVMARAVRAMVMARRGRFGEAEALVRVALLDMDTSDFPSERADVRMALAEVLSLAGRNDEAASAIREAISFYEGKGNVVQVRAATAKLADLRTSPS